VVEEERAPARGGASTVREGASARSGLSGHAVVGFGLSRVAGVGSGGVEESDAPWKEGVSPLPWSRRLSWEREGAHVEEEEEGEGAAGARYGRGNEERRMRQRVGAWWKGRVVGAAPLGGSPLRRERSRG
jgi:hypothetical protein